MFRIINKNSLNEYGIYARNVILIKEVLNQYENKKLIYNLVCIFDFADLIIMNAEKKAQLKQFRQQISISQSELLGIIDIKNEKINRPETVYVLYLLIIYLYRIDDIQVTKENQEDLKIILDKILKFNKYAIDEFIKADLQTGKYLAINPAMVEKQGPVQLFGLKHFEKWIEINSRIVQGIGLNYNSLDQFHSNKYSLNQIKYMPDEKELIKFSSLNNNDFDKEMNVIKENKQYSNFDLNNFRNRLDGYQRYNININPIFVDCQCE